ncbi:MAG: nuclear transport factor 2 family protein [Patescibacteria group bacterium]|nr:nuclear transport factor 2 family protein [Patescibacteria group bacterium]
MTRQEAVALIDTYGRAWINRDADLILTIFTPDATYFDPCEGEQKDHEGIKAYWQSKIVGAQKDISFKLLNLWLDEDGQTVIAEWNAIFTDTVRNLRIDMHEVAIFGVRDDKFSSLREYYRTDKTPL